jgi:hypothetical protein
MEDDILTVTGSGPESASLLVRVAVDGGQPVIRDMACANAEGSGPRWART